VAEFLGHINWLPGTVRDPSTVDCGTLGTLTCPVPATFAGGMAVSVGVRVEDVGIVDAAARENTFRAVVSSRMFQGDGYAVSLDVGGIRVLAETTREVEPSDVLQIHLPPQRCMVFASGDRATATPLGRDVDGR
jgi:ABC-type Fe3+/spermidine/putrescine transport system ATPase subunit